MPTLVSQERDALCDTALELGPEAPTLAGEWTARDLVCHLLVRERNPLAAPGIQLSFLSWLTEREMARLARHDFTELVERFRTRPRLSPVALDKVDALFNTLELFVHHEDLRRAQPEWVPRDLDARALGTLFKAISAQGKILARPAGVPVVIRRADTEREAVLVAPRDGLDPVVVTGPVQELVLFLFGRAQTVGLGFTGPPEAVAQLREAALGI